MWGGGIPTKIPTNLSDWRSLRQLSNRQASPGHQRTLTNVDSKETPGCWPSRCASWPIARRGGRARSRLAASTARPWPRQSPPNLVVGHTRTAAMIPPKMTPDDTFNQLSHRADRAGAQSGRRGGRPLRRGQSPWITMTRGGTWTGGTSGSFGFWDIRACRISRREFAW
jgi:hypothetical protein